MSKPISGENKKIYISKYRILKLLPGMPNVTQESKGGKFVQHYAKKVFVPNHMCGQQKLRSHNLISPAAGADRKYINEWLR